MTAALLKRLIDILEPSVGPIVTQFVINIILREAKLDFSDEQKAQLLSNRVAVLNARADEARRISEAPIPEDTPDA